MNGRRGAGLAVGWAAGWLVAGRPVVGRRHTLVPSTPAPVGVTVVVPARNEANRLPTLMTRLEAARSEVLEVVVVDDASTDGTDDVAVRFGASVFSVAPPPGWTGKAYACWEGARRARGEILVFLDADTAPAPGAVAAIAAQAWADGGLVSVQPWHRTVRPYEWLSACCNLIAVLGSGTGVASPQRWWRRPMAFGPVMAISRDAYFRVGGHAAVRSSVTEDLDLARAVDAAGMRVRVLLGGELLQFRMYPDGASQLVEGWTKNLAIGAGATPPVRLAAITAWIAAMLAAAVGVAGAGYRAARERRGSMDLAWAAAFYALFAAQLHLLLREVGRFGPAAVCYPVPLVTFVALWARSVLAVHVRRRVSWRGRVLTIGRR